jgi:hypothetical protein
LYSIFLFFLPLAVELGLQYVTVREVPAHAYSQTEVERKFLFFFLLCMLRRRFEAMENEEMEL